MQLEASKPRPFHRLSLKEEIYLLLLGCRSVSNTKFLPLYPRKATRRQNPLDSSRFLLNQETRATLLVRISIGALLTSHQEHRSLLHCIPSLKIVSLGNHLLPCSGHHHSLVSLTHLQPTIKFLTRSVLVLSTQRPKSLPSKQAKIWRTVKTVAVFLVRNPSRNFLSRSSITTTPTLMKLPSHPRRLP